MVAHPAFPARLVPDTTEVRMPAAPENYMKIGGNAYWLEHHPHPVNSVWVECPLTSHGTPDMDSVGAVDLDRIDPEYAEFFKDVTDRWLFINAAWSTAQQKVDASSITAAVNRAIGLPIAKTEGRVTYGAVWEINGMEYFVGLDLNEGNTYQLQVNHPIGSEYVGEAASASTYSGSVGYHALHSDAFRHWLLDCIEKTLKDPTALEIKF